MLLLLRMSFQFWAHLAARVLALVSTVVVCVAVLSPTINTGSDGWPILFSWHPVFMTVSVVLLSTQGITSYVMSFGPKVTVVRGQGGGHGKGVEWACPWIALGVSHAGGLKHVGRAVSITSLMVTPQLQHPWEALGRSTLRAARVASSALPSRCCAGESRAQNSTLCPLQLLARHRAPLCLSAEAVRRNIMVVARSVAGVVGGCV